MDIRRQFGARIRELRQANQWTQEELADRARISVPYLSRIENGHWNASLALIADLSRALGVQPFELLKTVDVTKAPRTRRRRAS